MTIVRPRGKDHYGLLGVWPSASPTVIEAAYNRALQLCEGDPEAKRRTKEAYRVLTNARARAQYDARIEAYTWASMATAQPTLESEVIETRQKVAKRRHLGPGRGYPVYRRGVGT
jgi:DnaJ-class molecular chaperone